MPSASPGVAVAALAAVGLSLVLTEVVRRIALRYRLTDRPAVHKAHARPTPYLGGVAIMLATLGPALVVRLVHGGLDGAALRPLVVLAGAAAAVSVVGLLDDITPLSPRTRLAVEAGAATLVAVGGYRVALTGRPWVDVALSAAWIVVATNSYNLLDNMDGAAASVVATTATVLGVASFAAGQPGRGVLLLCLAGSCLGFLAHNRPPARIFMGDAGSLFAGFLLAACAAATAPAGVTHALAALTLVTFVPIVDTCLVLVCRRRRGRSWFAGGTDHVAHRLRRLGMPTGTIAALLSVVAGGSSAMGILVLRGRLPAPYLLAIAFALVAAWVAVRLLLKVPATDDGTTQHCLVTGEYSRGTAVASSAGARALANDRRRRAGRDGGRTVADAASDA